jgi:hypothetical protein
MFRTIARMATALLVAANLFDTADLASACDSRGCACRSVESLALSRQGVWWIATTGNFRVCSLAGAAEAERTARQCEAIRADLIGAWALAEETAAAWRPKCQVILHASPRGYAAAIGGPAAPTYGSSLVQPATGPIRTRRIDLRTDVADVLTTALPHELCHVLLADRFRERATPLWYDEGLALLADSAAKQQLHERDRLQGTRWGLGYSLTELVAARQYPAANRMGVFYGQCAALTRYLLTQGTPEQLHRFAARVQDAGLEQAATEVYGLRNGQELERQWLAAAAEPRSSDLVRALPVALSVARPRGSLTLP